MGTPLEKHLEFKILKDKSTGLSKEFFAVGKNVLNIFFSSFPKGMGWERKTFLQASAIRQRQDSCIYLCTHRPPLWSLIAYAT